MSEQKFKSMFRRLQVQAGDHYAKGWDAAVNGPTTENCHFSLFNTPENTREWERGNKAGLAFTRESSQSDAKANAPLD